MQDDKGGYRQINKSLNICAFYDYLEGQTARLPQLANVEQLTPNVLRILGQNPGKHGDHTGGVPDLIRLYPDLQQHIYKNKPDNGQRDITDRQTFQVEGATVRAIHVPGHSEDSVCFILEEEQAMFTGDNILGHSTSAVEDLGTFMASLQKMADQKCAIGYSAHGDMIANLPAKISREPQQKLRRERQVIQALGRVRSRGEKSATVRDIVTEIYGASLDEETRTLALEPVIREVLRKLAGDGKVAFEMRARKKKWFSIGAAVRSSEVKGPAAVINVQVHELVGNIA